MTGDGGDARAALVAEALAMLRRFPCTEAQEPGMAAAIVLIETMPVLAALDGAGERGGLSDDDALIVAALATTDAPVDLIRLIGRRLAQTSPPVGESVAEEACAGCGVPMAPVLLTDHLCDPCREMAMPTEQDQS